jgi:predicted P-loop ATPase
LPLDADQKVIIERTSGKWIIEVADMHGLHKSKVDLLKAMLSRDTDRSRLSYGHYAVERPRQWINIGTTNLLTNYLKDQTGNRRFWPVRVQRFDLDSLRRDRDQLWAEAVVREAAGESIRLAEALWPAATREQAKREAPDPWEEGLSDYFDLETVNCLPVQYIWGALGSATANNRNNDHANRIAAVMQRYGFTVRKKLRVEVVECEKKVTRPMWCWLKPEVMLDEENVKRDELRVASYLDKAFEASDPRM